MLQPTDFYFIRHGETDWNRDYRAMGQKDIPLNSRGVEQAQNASQLLMEENICTICHSPLSRAKQTAEIIAANMSATLIEVPDLIECSWGQQEGQVKGQWVDDWIFGKKIAQAEDYQNFLKRALSGINQSLTKKGPVLIVSHGGIFWAIQQFGKLGLKYDLPNSAPVYLRAPVKIDLPWSVSDLN